MKKSAVGAFLLFVGPGVVSAQAQSPVGEPAASNWRMLTGYCSDCHNSEDWAGSLSFELLAPDTVHAEAVVWEKVLRKLRGRLMPPPGSLQPEQREIDDFAGWLENTLDQASDGPRAGHVPVQRMNRTEYQLAVKELLGVDIDAAEYLPTELEVDGFDNIAAALSMSPAFLDQYISVARAVAALAVGETTPKLASVFHVSTGGSQSEYQNGFPLGSRGGIRFVHNFPADGEYQFNIPDLDVGLYPRAAETTHTLVILVAGREIFRETIGGEEDLSLVDRLGAEGRVAVMERFTNISAQVSAGAHDVIITFIERSKAASDWNVASGGARVPRVLAGVEVVGPFNPTGLSLTPSRAKVFVCEPLVATEEQACAERITAHLAQTAFRRPVEQTDLDNLLPFYEAGRENNGDFNAGIEQVIAAVLVSPDFLYRTISPQRDIGDAQAFALNDLELASRLSFFLWSQGPDAQLLELASDGELGEPAVLEQQVRRMLADGRAQSLVRNFALKWLNLDDLTTVDPIPGQFPEYSVQLREDFATELELFIGSILLEERNVGELLTAQHTFLNERLARHYDIESVFGAQFRRVELQDDARWGLLGKSAMLLRTSYGDRTSPVLRGAWVLDKLMGTPPTPPPPNVETDLSAPPGELPTTVRARLEAHRANPECGQCHGVIDPIGLALENFDVTGKWREVDGQANMPIDARSVMPSGIAIDGPVELRRELTKRPEQFVQALTEKLLMYALNRELEYFDMPQVRAIVAAAEEEDYRLSALVLGIVQSDAFRMQALPHAAEEIAAQVAVQPSAHTLDNNN